MRFIDPTTEAQMFQTAGFKPGLDVATQLQNIQKQGLANKYYPQLQQAHLDLMHHQLPVVDAHLQQLQAFNAAYPEKAKALLENLHAKTFGQQQINKYYPFIQASRIEAGRAPKLTNFEKTYNAMKASKDPAERRGLARQLDIMSTAKRGISVSSLPGGGMNFSMGGAQQPQGPGYFENLLFPTSQKPDATETAEVRPDVLTMSRRSPKGGTVTVTKDGQPSTLTGATGQTTTNIQTRQLAGKEAAILSPFVWKGIAPYLGLGGSKKLYWDIHLAKSGDPAAKERVINYLTAKMLKKEVALNRLKEAQASNIGEESVRSMADQLFPGMPYEFISDQFGGQFQPEAGTRSQDILHRGIGAVAHLARSDFPLKGSSGLVAALSKGALQKTQKTQKEGLKHPIHFSLSGAAPIQAQITIPAFKDRAEFNKWNSSLTPAQRNAARAQMRGR